MNNFTQSGCYGYYYIINASGYNTATILFKY